MITIKAAIKYVFPNLVDDIILEKQKRRNKNEIDKVSRLKEMDYPEFLSQLYNEKTGNTLRLDNPQRFTEKIQWRKLYDHNPIYSDLSDKYTVRTWVRTKIGEDYLVPLLGVWDHFSDIEFEKLPDQFVLKTNNASHTNVIVDNKKSFLKRKQSIGRRMEYWLEMPFAFLEGLELQYLAIKPRIIAEEYLTPEKGKKDLTDYKFFCFDGNPYFCQVIGDRSIKETIDFYNHKWEHLNLKRPPHPNAEELISKPKNYNLMIELAAELSKGFKFVRVDLYENNDKVYFGEMTFTPASGMMKFDPDDWDYRLGSLWDIHTRQIDQSWEKQ